MELGKRIDIYCERMDPSFWAEPINALTNVAFLIAALWAAPRLRGAGLPRGMALAGLLFAIGIGSFLFHSFATVWAALADMIPIALFVMTFFFALHRDVIGLPPWGAWLSLAGFIAYATLAGGLFATLPFFEISSGYWPIMPALMVYAIALRSRGLALAAALLSVSLTMRSLDMSLCTALPFGTHFLWHVLNAILLGLLIDTYRRAALAGRAARG